MANDEYADRTPGAVVHTEIRSEDTPATVEFMTDVFGWRFSESPSPVHFLFSTPEGAEGHIGPTPEGDDGPSATSYLLVEDVDETAERIAARGGTIVQPATDIPHGRYLWFRPPGGPAFVAFQSNGG